MALRASESGATIDKLPAIAMGFQPKTVHLTITCVDRTGLANLWPARGFFDQRNCPEIIRN